METIDQLAKPQFSPDSLFVIVLDPEKVYFQGKAVAISSVNEKGPFDILLQHENFISIIKDRIIIHLSDKKAQEIPFKQGVLKAEKNAIYIFLELEAMLGKEK